VVSPVWLSKPKVASGPPSPERDFTLHVRSPDDEFIVAVGLVAIGVVVIIER
jgi:hypothetical protein